MSGNNSIEMTSFINLDGQTTIELLFLVMLGFYVIYTAVLYYHWSSYGSDLKVTTYTLSTYFLITVPIIIGLALITYVF
jgi:uncharacterized protein (UPF0333 family)